MINKKFLGISAFVRSYLLETASEKISRRLRIKLFDSLLTKNQTFFDSAKTGDLVSRLGSDITTVSRSVMDGSFGFRVLINAVIGTAMVIETVPIVIVPQLLAPGLHTYIYAYKHEYKHTCKHTCHRTYAYI